jgi:hypothetical protein
VSPCRNRADAQMFPEDRAYPNMLAVMGIITMDGKKNDESTVFLLDKTDRILDTAKYSQNTFRNPIYGS